MLSPRIPWRIIFARLTLVALGVLLALATLEAGMRAAGYLMRLAQRHRNQQALARKHEVRVLCLGESTTAGLGKHGSYPETLEAILNRQDLGVRFAVVNRGRIGATTRQIIAALEQDLDELEPDLVVAMMGINDVGERHAYGSIIAPGLYRWYGSFRVYKLYRLIHVALERRWGREALDRSARKSRNEQAAATPLFPPVSREIAQLLRDAKILIERNAYEEAEARLDGLLRDNSNLPKAYVELARVFRQTGRTEEAHRLLLRGVELVSPASVGLHNALAGSHLARGETEAAIRQYRLIIDSLLDESLLHPTQVWDHTYYRLTLADSYEDVDKLDLAEEALLEIVEKIDPSNDIAYQPLIDFYERHGRTQLAAAAREKQLRMRREYVNPKTQQNLRVLRQALRTRKIPLIAVQYPGRRLETLQRLHDHDSSVTYVDNGIFKDIERADGYDSLYADRFAGDFGHLTERGKYLLASNVARAIIEEIFGRPFEDSIVGS